jgi:beta-glucosidase
MNVVVDEATLREVYFWPFEVAASRGVWGMLTAYNRVNGIIAPSSIRPSASG